MVYIVVRRFALERDEKKEAANILYLISLCHCFSWLFFASWIINKQIPTRKIGLMSICICFSLDRKKKKRQIISINDQIADENIWRVEIDLANGDSLMIFACI